MEEELTEEKLISNLTNALLSMVYISQNYISGVDTKGCKITSDQIIQETVNKTFNALFSTIHGYKGIGFYGISKEKLFDQLSRQNRLKSI